MKDTQIDIEIIVAYACNRAIGYQGQIPWHLPKDFLYFKKTTTHHCIVMGRKTFESIGRALPNRQNIVLTRQSNYLAEGCQIASNLNEAIKKCEREKLFIIGGQQLYTQSLAFASMLHLTTVETFCQGDSFFPEIDLTKWQYVQHTHHPHDTKHNHAFTITTMKRV